MTDLSHDLRISREALAAAERRADEAERARDELLKELGGTFKEYAARSGWLSPEQGAEKVKATIERCAVLAEEYDGPEVDSQGWDVQLGDANATKHAIARDIRALAAHPTEEA